ncbi:MAG: penicillin-binding transpeptidase domain-containing protein [Dethiobacteria bacterium]|jgi:cell division protein FtsI/penicillin-binding protein 2|nr:penicillin-binding transpeptidase domain-containing protein [Bacillota bacterium]HQD52491.1 penicillin-binding transpeptidase domain-containing protein [Bacillota bacterium]
MLKEKLGFNASIRLLLPVLLILLLFSSGCSRIQPEATAEQFYALWGEQDYKAMYELLDSASRKAYSAESFVERYTSISRGIGLHAVELKEVEKTGSSAKRVTLSLSAVLKTSTVGPIPVSYSLELSREKRGAPWLLQWHPGLIFPQLSDDSRVDLDLERPRRGGIHDRNGKVLAGPRLFKELGAVPGVYEDEKSFAAAVESLLGLSSATIIEKLHQPWVQEGHYVPLAVLSPEEESLVDRLLQIPGAMINEVERRSYPAGSVTAHLVGYLGEINSEELQEKEDEGYHAGDLLGKAGLEAALEQKLAGDNGYTLRILDQDGNEEALIATRELQDGEDITLTIDLELQKCVAEALGKKKGAVVALDPHTGELLALYSNPSFDPNRIVAGLTAKEWEKLNKDEAFLNRALSGIYPPGSAFKPFTAAAAIAEKAIDPAAKVEIKGERWQPSKAWGDYHVRRVHPEVESLDLNEAMKFSDNIYFARAGLALGEKKFLEYGKRFGFDEQISFPLPVARSRLAREGIKSEVQLADSSFGQGEVMITPLQMALLYSAIATKGSIPQPRLLLSDEPALWKENVISPAVAETVHRSLVETLHGARAPAAAGVIPGFNVAGKTGTAEIDAGEGNICWYVTYGPAESPGIVVVAAVEGSSGWAVTEALPVGRAVLEHYLRTGKD